MGGRETRWGGVEVEGIGELKEARRWIGMYKICVGRYTTAAVTRQTRARWLARKGVFFSLPPGFRIFVDGGCWLVGQQVRS